MKDDNELIDTGTTSIHVSKNDVDVFRKYGLRSRQVGQVYHRAVREMDEYRELSEDLRTLLDRFDEGDVALGAFLQRVRSLTPEPEIED